MAQIKNNFTAAKMNKDLDERLVPTGEYRDALNIQVTSSEGSDIGAIENLLGNEVLLNKSYNKATKKFTQWNLETTTKNHYGFENAKAIGVIAYGKEEKIYWLVSGSNFDGILEYDQTTDVISPIVVDANRVLQFSPNRYITGINILDGVLYFTDDYSEPKRIDIAKFKTATEGIIAHTQIYGRDFIESDITVARLSPLAAPELEMYSTDRLDPNGNVAVVEANTTYNFQVPDIIEVGDEITLSLDFIGNYPYFKIGDTLILTWESDNEEVGELEIRVKVVDAMDTATQDSITVSIVSIPDEDMPVVDKTWKVRLEQDPPMFEFKFVKFGYRYIYEDNQVSCFSPFSKPAFLPSKFEYDAYQAWNLGMKNELRNLKIKNFASNIPDGVQKIDILYKAENNTNVYVVDTIEKDENGDFVNDYTVRSEIISRVVESNQIIRPWDNVPRKAKAQEITANRLIYGNYVQNFNINEPGNGPVKPKLSISVIPNVDAEVSDEPIPNESIKTLRTYQAGIVYKDAYGRETPVFSSENSSVNLDKTQSDGSNRLSVKIESNPPEGFTHFKFFIKENSDEYYNLVMDRFYLDGDNNVWLSFPSAERNKVDENTFLILKKGHGSNDAVKEDARYKIIDISNEAPLPIKKKRISKATMNMAGKWPSNGYPTEGATFIRIAKSRWHDAFTKGDNDVNSDALLFANDLSLRFYNESITGTSYHDIKGITFERVFDGDYYKIEFDAPIFNVSSIFGDWDSMANSKGGITIFENSYPDKPEYQGRFFAKIYNDAIFNQYVVEANKDEENVEIVAQQQIKYAPGGGWDWEDHKGNGFFIDEANNEEVRFIKTGSLKKINPLANASNYDGDTSPYNGRAIHGRGAWKGNRYVDIAYHRFGPNAKGQWDSAYYKVGVTNRLELAPIINAFETPGSLIRFGTEGKIYKIMSFSRFHCKDGHRRKAEHRTIRWTLELDEVLETDYVADLGLSASTAGLFQIVKPIGDERSFSIENPAVFETEPKEVVDLNLFYEASDAYDISLHGSVGNEQAFTLPWFNCYSFGNGVESDRIRDDFNATRLGKGVKVSTTLDVPYKEERRANGLIFSQIYNSISGLNNINQFIQGEAITKDLDPAYGSIQKLHARDNDLITFCEDKVFKVLANKDALYNADGNANVTSNNNVLGQAIPYRGEFGISLNPESFASYGYRAYFTDRNRGIVLRLSGDGLEDISGNGMSDYFKDALAENSFSLGSYDDYLGVYTLTLGSDTLLFDDSVNGWSTRTSYLPETGVTLNNTYYTFKEGEIWSHTNEIRNNFYGEQYRSTVKLVFNAEPSKVKNFKTMSYEGTSGWTTPLIQTDLQDGKVPEYIPKEGIYFNFIKGNENTWDDFSQTGSLDTAEFSTQGIGYISSYTGDAQTEYILRIEENND